ncbi:lysostaphin resistance A-like protein [Halosegnis sp.]|uniref:CPBP family intramembrane glutamic endopeptidase n=1 Tax=Halosegnis sp. TaxID=2864959 RepID=UPI0035D41C8C
MTDWGVFLGVATLLTVLLLGLARATSAGAALPTRGDVEWLDSLPDEADHLAVGGTPAPTPAPAVDLSSGALFVNVLISHGLFLVLLTAAAIYAAVPAAAFGLSASPREIAIGVGFGLALALLNTAAGSLAESLGYAPGAELRGLLAPDSRAGWLLLLGGTLPLVAVFEEALFRGALIGAFALGLGISPWALAVVSSALFAIAHEIQGPVGVLVTGTLGFALAAGYVVTDSLLVVVVAHYLVNAVELLARER